MGETNYNYNRTNKYINESATNCRPMRHKKYLSSNDGGMNKVHTTKANLSIFNMRLDINDF